MVQLIEIIIEAYNKTLSFADNVTSKFDDEKFAKAVNDMYGQEPTYAELDAQIELIKIASDISTQDKLDLLRAISVQRDIIRDSEIKRKNQCAEIIDKGMEKKGEIVTKIVVGVFSCGISLLPEACHAISGHRKKNKDESLTIE